MVASPPLAGERASGRGSGPCWPVTARGEVRRRPCGHRGRRGRRPGRGSCERRAEEGDDDGQTRPCDRERADVGMSSPSLWGKGSRDGPRDPCTPDDLGEPTAAAPTPARPRPQTRRRTAVTLPRICALLPSIGSNASLWGSSQTWPPLRWNVLTVASPSISAATISPLDAVCSGVRRRSRRRRSRRRSSTRR